MLEELGVGCQWPIGAIAQMKDKQFCIYSILLTKEGEVLKEHTEKGSIRDAVQFGKKIGKVFKDYVPPYKEPNGEDCYWSRGNGIQPCTCIL